MFAGDLLDVIRPGQQEDDQNKDLEMQLGLMSCRPHVVSLVLHTLIPVYTCI